jgi:thiol-disulfide isomerase/thioredoxin
MHHINLKKIFMRKNSLLLLISAATFIASCGKSSDSGTDGGSQAGANERPTVKVSKGSITADGFETTVISVVDKNGNDISNQSYVTINGTQVSNFKFNTAAIGTNTVKAKFNNLESAGVIITATDPGASKYSQKVIAEDYTGAWCGYCPRVAHALQQAENANPKIITVAVHNADALAFPLEATMRAKWGVSSFPTAVINRKYQWNENAGVLNAETTKWAPLGLSIESAIAGSAVTGKVKTEFNVNTDYGMTVTVMLIEDGKVLAQTNYYNATSGSPFFGQGNPIPNYVHNHTLRLASTNIFGDAVPVAAQTKGNIHETSFSFNAAAYDVTKCSIVALVAYADASGRQGVLNVQEVKAGQNQAFD